MAVHMIYIQVFMDSLADQNWFPGNNCWSYFQGYSENQRIQGNFGQYAILEKPTNILLTRSHREKMRIIHEFYIQTLMDSLADLNWFPENN